MLSTRRQTRLPDPATDPDLCPATDPAADPATDPAHSSAMTCTAFLVCVILGSAHRFIADVLQKDPAIVPNHRLGVRNNAFCLL